MYKDTLSKCDKGSPVEKQVRKAIGSNALLKSYDSQLPQASFLDCGFFYAIAGFLIKQAE